MSKNIHIDILYKNAQNYLNELKSKSAAQRLNDNGD
jgi:hypothetical protein